MNRDKYPALRSRPDFVYLDASNGFPLHERIIQQATTLASTYVGVPSKGEYSDTLVISDIVEQTRHTVAQFIGADASEIHFVGSASEAVKLIVEGWCTDDAKVAYSPEDHTATLRALTSIPDERKELLAYSEGGVIEETQSQPDVLFACHYHHLYGTDVDIAAIRTHNPDARLVIDASQSISRCAIDVHDSGIDALYFSGHKLGAIPGIGILYVAKKYQSSITFSHASLPWHIIASLGTAIDILTERPMTDRSLYLSKLSGYATEQLQHIPGIELSKGIAHDLETCSGNGIISFRIHGLSSYDVMILLDEFNIAVRGGDHCVSPDYTSQDYVRISMQAYTTEDDIDRLIVALKSIL